MNVLVSNVILFYLSYKYNYNYNIFIISTCKLNTKMKNSELCEYARTTFQNPCNSVNNRVFQCIVNGWFRGAQWNACLLLQKRSNIFCFGAMALT